MLFLDLAVLKRQRKKELQENFNHNIIEYNKQMLPEPSIQNIWLAIRVRSQKKHYYLHRQVKVFTISLAVNHIQSTSSNVPRNKITSTLVTKFDPWKIIIKLEDVGEPNKL